MAGPSDYRMKVADWIAFPEEKGTPRLPDFTKILHGKVSKDETREFVDSFSRIFREEGFPPLLVEIAAILDERERQRKSYSRHEQLNDRSYFVSSIVSYIDGAPGVVSGVPHLFDVWMKGIEGLVKQAVKQDTFTDFVPHPATYKYVYFAEPLERHMQGRQPLPPQIARYLTTSPPTPVVSGSERYEFRVPKSDSLIEFATVFDTFANLLFDEAQSTHFNQGRSWLQDVLSNSLLIIVPFRRQIVYAEELDPLPIGGRPGGCLLALLMHSDEFRNPDQKKDPYRHLRRAAVRVSWLLQQAALREGDSKATLEREMLDHSRSLLRMIGHAATLPLSIAAKEFRDHASEVVREMPKYSDGFGRIKSSLEQAEHAVNSIDKLIRLDPQAEIPEIVAEAEKELRKGRTHLATVILDLQNHPYFKRKGSQIRTLGDLDIGIVVIGDEDVWFLVIWLLLKNATEEAGSKEVVVELRSDPQLGSAVLRIINPARRPLDSELLQQMNRAVAGRTSRIKSTKGGLGIGLATIGRILSCFGCHAIFIPKDNDIELRISGITQYAQQ